MRGLLRDWRTFVIAGLAIGAGAVIGGAIGGIGIGAAAAGVVLLYAWAVVWIIADSKAGEDFFSHYAAERSLAIGGHGGMPAATNLLRAGLRRYMERGFAGKLPGGAEGLLALYTYETESTDTESNTPEYHAFTVVLTEVAEATPFIGELACQRRRGFRFFDSAEDKFRSRQRVELESEEVDKRYEIFIGEKDDMNRARQLFSPTFVDWLSSGDEKLAFELEGGMLACYRPGHFGNAAELDEICEAASRIRETVSSEALESADAGATPPAPSYEPRSWLRAEDSKAPAKRTRARLFALPLLLFFPLAIWLGIYASNYGDSGESDQTIRVDRPKHATKRVTVRDEKLLALIAEKDDGSGVTIDDLSGEGGVSPSTAGEWWTEALKLGLIELDHESGISLSLTPFGERIVERKRS